jgi:hypothetical protein
MNPGSPATDRVASPLVKVAYKPLALVVSALAGLVAARLFARLWRLLPGASIPAPTAEDPSNGWAEVAVAAAVHGAVFGAVRAIVNRVSARGIERATGTWPE